MAEARAYETLLAAWFVIATISALVLWFIPAPYGRHARRGWGPSIPSTAGWIVMEAPSAIVMAALWVAGPRRNDPAAIALATLWIGHYFYRSFVFPLTRAGRGRPMPLAIPVLASVFNVGNAYLNGRWLFALGPERGAAWLSDPRFVIGVSLFGAGFATHLRADAILARLRQPGETGYKIPHGFLFDEVSCPNYFGELVEWAGWALAAWSLAGVSFAFWTAANLVPRAVAHHRWYRETFPGYPIRRRAIIPRVL